MKKIKIGIYGYGNLGKGVEIALKNNSDMELVGVFTRRDPDTIETIFNDTKVYSAKEINNMKGKIDVMVLCGGSATDLPVQTPEIASMFNVVDSFDNHANIEKHFNNFNQVSKENNTLALISCGWDPGLFSLNRALFEAVLPNGTNYVFYGRGLSQGHSDAIRRIKGVKKAVQYTVPYEESVKKVKNGEDPQFSSVREVMWRECFVVLEEEADSSKIEKEIKEMPNYFEPYNINIALLTGSTTKKNKEKIYEELESGHIDLLIGTHSLLNEQVIFKNLGLVITDEQHRFGVNQRNLLQNKGNKKESDVLYLSATPIPRTYALTIYGDLDLSQIKTKPNIRKEVITKVVLEKNIKDVFL